MIKLLVVAAIVAVSAADRNGEIEEASQTYMRPDYMKPHEPYHKHQYHHHRRDHGRYHHNYADNMYHKEAYKGVYHPHYYRHEEHIPHHSYNPHLEHKLEADHMYAYQMPTMYNGPHHYMPHSPIHKPDHTIYNSYGPEYGYVPIKEAYHNISPYLERRVDHKYPNYSYDHGYGHAYGYGYPRY